MPTWAMADFEIYELSGSMTSYGTTLGVGDMVGDGTLNSSGSLGPASAKLRPASYDTSWRENPYGARGVARFTAVGDAAANYMLPSDRWGNSSAGTVGETRDFLTWNYYMGQNYGGGHEFGMSVDSAGDESSIAIAFNAVGTSLQSTLVSDAIITTLDNGVYDLNPADGEIKINPIGMPTTFDAVTSAYDIVRGQVSIFGDLQASPFYDAAWTSAYLELSQDGKFLASRFSAFGPMAGTWSAGEGETTRFADRQTVRVDFDLSGLAPGHYDMKLSDIVWQSLGSDQGLFSDTFPGEGTFRVSRTYALEVVPEPATLAALGVGLVALVRRRRRN